MAAPPDVIGQTIGNAVAGRIAGNGSGDGGSIFDAIGDGLSAAGDWLGFDGSFGYQGPEGRSLSLGGLGDAIGNVIAPPAAAATMTGDDQVIRGFGPYRGASLTLISGGEPSDNYNAILDYTREQARYAVHAERVFGIEGLAEATMGAIGEEYRTLNGVDGLWDYLGDLSGSLNLEFDRPSEFYGRSTSEILDERYLLNRSDIRSGRAWQGGFFDKLADPTQVDRGVGNFNVGLAIDQFHDYRASFIGQTFDPFQFSQYDNNLTGLFMDMLPPDRPTLVYMTAIKLADVDHFYRDPMRYAEAQGWEMPGGAETAAALTSRYLNSTGTERAQMLDAGYKQSYLRVATQANEGRFGVTDRTGGYIDYFHDSRSPWSEQVRITAHERWLQAIGATGQ